MILDKRGLVELLEELSQLVNDDDSFEGNISYNCMKEGLPPGHYDVVGGFRHGNSMGQGGFALLPEMEENVQTNDD